MTLAPITRPRRICVARAKEDVISQPHLDLGLAFVDSVTPYMLSTRVCTYMILPDLIVKKNHILSFWHFIFFTFLLDVDQPHLAFGICILALTIRVDMCSGCPNWRAPCLSLSFSSSCARRTHWRQSVNLVLKAVVVLYNMTLYLMKLAIFWDRWLDTLPLDI